MISKKQKELLQHTLGADSRYKKKDWGFRNHFVPGDASTDPDRPDFIELEKQGLVVFSKRMDNQVIWATKKGAKAIGFKPYQLRKMKFPAAKVQSNAL
jgi:hypothetical protein